MKVLATYVVPAVTGTGVAKLAYCQPRVASAERECGQNSTRRAVQTFRYRTRYLPRHGSTGGH